MSRLSAIAAFSICSALLLAAPVVALPQDKPASAPPAQASASTSSKPAINLNVATIEQLETLPGIGRKTAERILEYRTKNSGFKRIEDLMNVKGIGEKSFLKLKPLISVKPS